MHVCASLLSNKLRFYSSRMHTVFCLIILLAVCSTSYQQEQSCSEGNVCTVSDEPAIPTNSGTKIAKGSNADGRPPEISRDCVDRAEICPQYAAAGECERSPGWMIVNCAHSCNSCHLRDYEVRCNRSNLNMPTEPIYKPGDIDKMFSSILQRFENRYDVKIHSTSPWVVTFDNFLTEAESNALLYTVEGDFERSTDTGAVNEFGEMGRTLSKGRTSSSAWCRPYCMGHPDVQTILRKIEEVTYIPYTHYESFQVLQYDVGQYYNTHHDMGSMQKKQACGPRVLTFFLYLSDVEEGGETVFPRLDLKIKPKRGRALLWPSTRNESPEDQDPRTVHAAAPVIRGRKYAANAWIRMYDFVTPFHWGCTGAFDYL